MIPCTPTLTHARLLNFSGRPRTAASRCPRDSGAIVKTWPLWDKSGIVRESAMYFIPLETSALTKGALLSNLGASQISTTRVVAYG
jgi:hypothetical protein